MTCYSFANYEEANAWEWRDFVIGLGGGWLGSGEGLGFWEFWNSSDYSIIMAIDEINTLAIFASLNKQCVLPLLLLKLAKLFLLGQLDLVLQHENLIAQLLGHFFQMNRFDLLLNVLGHVIDTEAAMIEERLIAIGLVLLLHILQGTGNGLRNGWWRGNVLALGHEAAIVGMIIHTIQLAIITGVFVDALGMGAASVVQLRLLLAIDAVLGEETVPGNRGNSQYHFACLV